MFLEGSVFSRGIKLKNIGASWADSYISVQPYLLRNQTSKCNVETLSKSCSCEFLLLM